MRYSRLHAPTLKEIPNDTEVVSHQLLTRGGYLRKLAAGIYDYLPLTCRVLRRIESIVREELDAAGAQELLLPMVQPAEIWEESSRWQKYGAELLRIKDRKGADFCLGPTHEEVIVDLVRRDVRSWRSLPLNLYQIQTKFRDEIRPRAGLMRGREFLMKDAYSFDVDESHALESYEEMYKAYQRIFERCGLDFRPVEADTGSIGGSRSHEFQVLAESGEDAIVSCNNCGYAANVEQAEAPAPVGEVASADQSEVGPAVELETPNAKSVEEVAAYLQVPTEQILKSVVVEADGGLVLALVPGTRELNLIKLKRVLGATEIELASEEKVRAAFGASPGSLGPVGLGEGVVAEIIADHRVRGLSLICGANRDGYHLGPVREGRDFSVDRFEDLLLSAGGDPCPRCEGQLVPFRGIEVGHIFYLGTKYSEAMRCHFLDERGRSQPMVMGCYGIGISRIMAAAIEQNHDKDGIIWPKALAPFSVTILALQSDKEEVVRCAELIYARCREAGIEVLLDDRKERAGAKFKDADLQGIPLRVAVGARGVKEGVIELKGRREAAARQVPIDDALEAIMTALEESR
ncbi:MAG: proline--tRNA ligase [Myxococcota bacterium]|nr:proline--tRNA ligase [Myxococcota bacterium]